MKKYIQHYLGCSAWCSAIVKSFYDNYLRLKKAKRIAGVNKVNASIHRSHHRLTDRYDKKMEKIIAR